MKVSIIVPVYNVKDYLIKCLDSIHGQTLDDYEVIVVDDGSTDGSGAMIDAYCTGKEKFKVIHKENGGLMSAWMEGVQHASGEYLGFVDSDDYVDCEMYRKLMERAEKNGADIVMCNHYYEDSAMGGRLRTHRNPIKGGFYGEERMLEIKKRVLPRTGADYISPSRWSKIIRREVFLNNIKYCDPKIVSAEDVNIMVPCLLSCASLEYVDEPLYYYVMRKQSVSHVFRHDILDKYRILIGKLIKSVEENGLDRVLDCEPLYNFYGISWCNYIMEAHFSGGEKKRQYERLLQDETFRHASVRISKADGTIAGIYKIMFFCRQPFLYEFGRKAVEVAAKLVRRK